MASSNAIIQTFKNPEIAIVRSLRVASGEVIYEGTLVSIDSSGYAIPANNTDRCVGVAKITRESDELVMINYNHVAYYSLPGVTASDVGSTAYIVDSTTA